MTQAQVRELLTHVALKMQAEIDARPGAGPFVESYSAFVRAHQHIEARNLVPARMELGHSIRFAMAAGVAEGLIAALTELLRAIE